MQGSNANNCLGSNVWLEKESEEEYGCHTLHVNNILREKVCFYCNQRKPASLEEIAFSVILENTELLKRMVSALYHLPHRICWLIGRALDANLLSQAWKIVILVSQHGEILPPQWFDVDQSKIKFLLRFRLYWEVNQKLKPFMASRSAGKDEILHYLGSVDTKYKDFWSKMTSAITKLKAETESEDLAHLKNIICADENNVVLVNSTELKGYVRLDSKEYESMKELQRLSKTFACPVVFKPTTIGFWGLESHKIPNILENIDPQAIVDVNIGKRSWSIAEIDELGRVLSRCHNLSSICLGQHHTLDEVLEDVEPAVSRLLSQHHKLQKIKLQSFHFAGTLATYPMSTVETLELFLCTLTEEDWNFMATRSNLALKTLTFFSCFYSVPFPSFFIFIQNQARSLKHLTLDFPIVSVAEICKLLRIMAKFNELETFDLLCLEEMIDFVNLEQIIVDLMSIHSTRKFLINIPSNPDGSGFEAEINHLNKVMKELCLKNRRPPIKIISDLP